MESCSLIRSSSSSSRSRNNQYFVFHFALRRDLEGVDSPGNDNNPDVEVEQEILDDDHYLAMATKRSTNKPPSPAALRNMMSPSNARREEPSSNMSTRDTTTKRAANSTRLVNACTITYGDTTPQRKHGESLVDRGANGGIAGNDMRVITTSPQRTTSRPP